MDTSKISKIELISRGKNCDIYGNPYHAFILRIHMSYVSYAPVITIERSMSYGDSGKDDLFMWANQATKEAFGFSLYDFRNIVEHKHKTVYSDAELEHPENWRI